MKNILFSGFLFLIILSLWSCEEDGDEVIENNAPVANAGPDFSTSTGSTVVLDGSQSNDPDGDALSYLWEISTKPTESNVTLSNADQATASFIPDEAGTYTITLEVSDGTDTDIDEMIVTVEDEPQETIVVDSDINEETVWEDVFTDPAIPDYLVTNNINVNAKLTTEPGVVVHVAEQAIITVEPGGTFVASGTADAPIVFTSADEAGEVLWGGLLINSSSSLNSLEHTAFHFGGGRDIVYGGGWRSAALAVSENGKLNMSNTTISRSGGDGMFVVGKGNLGTFENNAFSQNEDFPLSLSINQLGSISTSNTFADDAASSEREDVVRIYDSVLDQEQEWSPLSGGAIYRFVGDVSIQDKLTIQEGTLMEFDENVVLQVTSDGVLQAKGSADNPILFTSSGIADGRKWSGIIIESSSINNELDHVEVSHAGGEENVYFQGWKAAAIGVSDGSKLSLTNSEISHSNGYGLVMHENTVLQAFSSNTFHDNANYPLLLPANMLGMMDEATSMENNAEDVVAVLGSALNDKARFSDDNNPEWKALSGEAKYLFLGKLTIDEQLELAPGAALVFDENVVAEVTSNGSLQAIGTADNKISFMAHDPEGESHWGGLSFNSSSTRNKLEHVEISHGGGTEIVYASGWKQANIGVADGAVLSLDNASIANSKGYGIVVHSNGQLTLGNAVTYSNNAQDDLFQE